MLPASLQDSRRSFEGVRFDVHTVELPGRDGERYRRDIVVHPGAVVILPILDDGRVVLIRNYRVSVGERLLELPAGTLEPGEDPAACAPRELIEETGYRARSLTPLFAFFSAPGICTELMHAYVAEGLEPVGQDLDAVEEISVEPYPLAEALAMVRDGRIRDAKTLATLLYFQAFRGGRG